MSRTKIRNRIKKYEDIVADHISNGRIVSAGMDQKVVSALKLKLQDTISSAKIKRKGK